MIGFDKAYALITALPERTGTELLALSKAQGRVLAHDVMAGVDAPRSNCSAMDGYAVREADLARLPSRLNIAGACYPGQQTLLMVPAGSCARIFTGATVPTGLDRIIVQEEVSVQDGEALFEHPLGQARHIRKQGSDFWAGDKLLLAGTRLDARGMLAAAASDNALFEVHRKPRVLVLGLGDELCAPGTARDSVAGIPESVSYGVAGMVEQWGGDCLHRTRLPDDLDELQSAAGDNLEEADLIIVSGGASVGERDFAKAMFVPHGLELIFSKVAIKPGKPVWLGRAKEKLVLGLPGNPSSALVCARLFLAPLLLRLSGAPPHAAWRWKQSPLAAGLDPGTERETFVRARWSKGRVQPLTDPDSSAQKTLAQADVLIRRKPRASALDTGQCVEVLEF